MRRKPRQQKGRSVYMVQLQIISKILQSQNCDILENNLLTEDYFLGYENEYHFIVDHYKQYGNVPDIPTFLNKFPSTELVEVTESDRYLVDTIREENLYQRCVPVIEKAAEYARTDANVAAEYLLNAMRTLQPNYQLSGTDIIADATDRYDQYIDRKENQNEWFFTTGFAELDDEIHGLQREEELFVIFARTNQGKSWVLEKMCTHIWELGFNIGYVSPEMSANSVGYRFDTLHKNFSNVGLMWGKDDVQDADYKAYIDTLKQEHHNSFIVSTPLDFDKKITVTKLKNWATQYKLNAIAIDGITYMTDERYKRGDNKTTTLTNIAEDLMGLSMELHIPVLVVVQANRTGVKEDDTDGTPELESIRDSDGISHNASKVLSIRQKQNGVLEMCVKKQRFGKVGGTLLYNWSINTGEFQFIPSYDDAQPTSRTAERVKDLKRTYSDEEDIF